MQVMQRVIGDDAFLYGVPSNCQTLGTFGRCNVEPQVTPQLMAVAELFSPNVLALA
jgi:hypothetical protein